MRVSFELLAGHPWVQVGGVAPDKPLDSAVLSRMKQFTAMNKLKKMALRVRIYMNVYTYPDIITPAYGHMHKTSLHVFSRNTSNKTFKLFNSEVVLLVNMVCCMFVLCRSLQRAYLKKKLLA